MSILERTQSKSWTTSMKHPFILSMCLFIISFSLLTFFLNRGFLKWGDYIIGLSTFFLGCTTVYLALTGMAEGNRNRIQIRELAAHERAISNYPLLSQKIEIKGVQSNVLIGGEDTQHYETHFMLLIKNYGKGPAINQDKIYYIFFKGENNIHQNKIVITGAHDIIEPDGERILDMTILSENDWNLGMETKFDNVWVRLLHEDIQRNECCNCTTYECKPQIKGIWGKIERYWYFASYPEISSEGCTECVWRALEDVTE